MSGEKESADIFYLTRVARAQAVLLSSRGRRSPDNARNTHSVLALSGLKRSFDVAPEQLRRDTFGEEHRRDFARKVKRQTFLAFVRRGDEMNDKQRRRCDQ